MTESEAYALIERYLSGEMTGKEAADFEAQLRQDPILAHRSRQFEELTCALQQFGRRQNLKEKMAAIHAEMEAETPPENDTG